MKIIAGPMGSEMLLRRSRRASELAVLALALFGGVISITSCGSPKQESVSQAPASAERESDAQSSAAVITNEVRMKAKDIFTSRCAACHGPDGRGDGPGAANLNPKPVNFHDKVWQKAVTNEEIEKAILYGGLAVGKSPLMVPNPDLQSQPASVAALREYIRQLGK
jgi:mono/diheme cytochrome c family protein